jgi:hypothetical protein
MVSGCASMKAKHNTTILIDRSTAERKECRVDQWRSDNSYKKYNACIENLQKQGYEIYGQY